MLREIVRKGTDSHLDPARLRREAELGGSPMIRLAVRILLEEALETQRLTSKLFSHIESTAVIQSTHDLAKIYNDSSSGLPKA